MVRYTKESLETLRSRIDLTDVLSQHMDLKRSGASYKALCPFHDEKTPSFMVQKGDSHYHCFGCGAHGDAIQFLMQHVKMGFTDAVEYLAERYSVPLEKMAASSREGHLSKGRIKEALFDASLFYAFFLLHTEEGGKALQYLYGRGLDLAFLERFSIGLSPKQEGLMRKVLHARGFSDEVLVHAGLLVERAGRLREFFTERVMFPIHDAMGNVIGFSARKIDEKTFGGKYINTTETELFKKSKILFGLHHCRRRIIKEKHAIIVEGQLDALRLIYHGFDYTVAALGTAFGEAHVHELVKLGVTRTFLLFDGDTAGQNASLKVGQLLQKEGVDVYVGTFEKGVDPDACLLRQGSHAIMKILMSAKEYLSFLVDSHTKTGGFSSPAEKNRTLQDIVQQIREWENPIMVHESIKKLASLIQVPEELLGVESRKIPFFTMNKSAHAAKEDERNNGIDPDRILETDFLRWLLICWKSNKEVVLFSLKTIQPSELRDRVVQKMYAYIAEHYDGQKELDFLDLRSSIDDEGIEEVLCQVFVKKVHPERALQLQCEVMQRIKERNWMSERQELMLQIHSGQGSEEEMRLLAGKFDTLNRERPSVLSST